MLNQLQPVCWTRQSRRCIMLYNFRPRKKCVSRLENSPNCGWMRRRARRVRACNFFSFFVPMFGALEMIARATLLPFYCLCVFFWRDERCMSKCNLPAMETRRDWAHYCFIISSPGNATKTTPTSMWSGWKCSIILLRKRFWFFLHTLLFQVKNKMYTRSSLKNLKFSKISNL